jgi:hypothetical protein
MQDASKVLAMCLWLIASDNLDGVIDASFANLSFRFRTPEEKIEKALNELIEKGFFLVVQDDSTTIAERKQVAPLEEERRDRGETDKSGDKSPDGFEKFWKTWPTSKRKGSKGKCQEVWKSKRLDENRDEIIAHVIFSKSHWKDPQFIPAPLAYLNQQRWDGAEINGSVSGSELGVFV